MSGPRFSLLIRGADLADGTGAPLTAGQVGVTGGRLRVLPPDAPVRADRVLDLPGCVVAPGFIDAHTHSDLTTLDGTGDAAAHGAVLQGVTVEICGNCGSSAFPAPYPDFGAFARAHAEGGRANHLASLVGHGTLRGSVVGHDARAATAGELAAMCEVLDRALADGAAGLSTGLIYTPGSYADTAEVTALAAVAAAHRKPYVTHLRDEMSGVEAALEEAVRIARDSGAPLHVSHHKTAGRDGWGGTERTLPRLHALRAEGMDVTCDVYPYTAGSTGLAAMLPPWAHDGGPRRLLERLRDAGQRERMRAAIADGVPGWENTVGNGGWDRISVAGAARHPELQGRTVADIASARGADAIDVVAELLLAEEGDVTIISHSMREDDVRRVLAAPFAMIGSDGVPKPGLPHPRWAGTFARVLGHYGRELGLLALPEAVHKMTGATAARFGLTGRGVLRDGGHADLVVFDPAVIADRATFTEPLLAPSGVRLVAVAGEVVVEDGETTSARPGRVIPC
ncbi:dihydroorotase/N-acyl-D-amino-acid deacylase [Actinacidiphila yanglinensis]|uniref:Dihydroorotase/N-acyl-D-amino-acid deacylase n=1 Tax=Actinacidiphila yanglinensis TaxID=310779 RepID=A0A1H6DQZ6_9ACTN|nr:amidohydrolase family protein [Actinacidiphila yanglinensis]SEG87719.1 dihydroorotase/N-acyl-D-amino-acid deacylase [Actinacidiphila yanglinensis]